MKYLSLLFLFCSSCASLPSSQTLLSSERQLTFAGKRTGEGYFSHDGAQMVFQSEREKSNPFYQIYLMDLDTGKTSRVSPGYGKTTCAWIHPDRDRILYASTHFDAQARKKQKKEIKFRKSGHKKRYSWDFDPHFDIFAKSQKAGKTKRLTKAFGYDAEASYSPDGKWIAFASNREAYKKNLSKKDKELLKKNPAHFMDIYIMDSKGKNLKRLTTSPGYDGGPFFDATGTHLTWRRFSADGHSAEIFTMNIDGTDQKQLTRLGKMSWAPYFHPSGDYLIFATNVHGYDNFELYIVDAEGEKNPVRVTEAAGFDGLPVFHPEGNQLSWTSNRGSKKQSQIFLAQWNDKFARRKLGLSLEPPLRRTRVPSPIISEKDVRGFVAELAGDRYEGRMTGTKPMHQAQELVLNDFRKNGLQTRRESFKFTAGAELGSRNHLENYELNTDWRPLAFSQNGKVKKAPIAFVGYGIVAPAQGKFKAYNAYEDINIKGKWVMVLRYVPNNIDQDYRHYLTRFSSLRHKAMTARDRGALGVLFVSGPNADVKNQLVKMSFDASLAGTSIKVISVTDNVAQELLGARDLKELHNKLDDGTSQDSFILEDKKLSAEVDVIKRKKEGYNAFGFLRLTPNRNAPAVVVGAHLDHLGHGLGTSSRAKNNEQGKIHFGADDNASGIAGLLELAHYFSYLKKTGSLGKVHKNILFAAWSGEELGLLGAYAYLKKKRNISAYVNMDMIGRLRDKLVVQGIGSSPRWPEEMERANIQVQLPVLLQEDPYVPSDAMAFYLKKFPVINFFTGAHEEYHTPRDTPDTLNYEGTRDVIRLVANVIKQRVQDPKRIPYAEVKQSKKRSRQGFRVYLGTIPDYANTDIKGVKLSGVKKGSPAEKAGLRQNDIIVKLAGKKIENIYDYTFALGALRPKKQAVMTIQRNGKKVQIEIIPESRD